MSAMLKTAQQFLDALQRANLKWKDSRDMDDGNSLVVCGVSGKNNARYDVLFIFDANGESAAVRVFKLITSCPEDKTLKMLDAINDLNNKYRWVKFCLDKDQDVSVQMDAYVNGDTDGMICVKLLLRIMKIIDESYPTFMHILWA